MITLKTLPQATAQEVFDQVVNHLAQQKERAVDEISMRCLYRLKIYATSDTNKDIIEKTLKCAAGCLIGDDEYNEKWDYPIGHTWAALVHEKQVPEDHLELLTDLQDAHDNSFYSGRELASGLERISKKHNLNFDVDKFLKEFYPVKEKMPELPTEKFITNSRIMHDITF